MDAPTLIRTSMGLKEHETYPQELIPLYTDHLIRYPNDTHFLVEFSKGPGDYGVVTCMESCFKDIPLTTYNTPLLGSFKAFHDHIDNTPAHLATRNARVAAAAAAAARRSAARDMKPQAKALAAALARKDGNAAASGSIDRKPFDVEIDTDVKPFLKNGQASSSDKKPLKRTSSAGEIYSDDKEDDKKPRIEGPIGARILANNNAQPAPKPQVPLDPTAAAIQKLDGQIKRWEDRLVQLRLVDQSSRDAAWYGSLDDANRTIAILKTQKLPLERNMGFSAAQLQARAVAEQQRAIQMAAIDQASAAARAAAAAAAGDLDGLGGEDDEDFAGGYTAPASEEMKDFLKNAVDGQDFEGNSTVDAAVKALNLKNQRDIIPGMAIPLLPHQLIGVSWMVEQENSKNYGGILGDAMGLGKTIQTCALMAVNQSSDVNERSTLVIAPLALLAQWKDEIESKMAEGEFKVLIHHGPTRAKNLKEMRKYDVVLTTYGTLSGEWPDEEFATKKAKKDGKGEELGFLKKQGLLYEQSWYRIVLDEAQYIRNRSTRSSRCVSHLDALFRWCLTGTPITNGLADVYPLLRFLQIKPWYTWIEWRNAVMIHEKKRPDLAGKKAQVVLKTCLLRRKIDSKLDGKPLITLPPMTITLHELEFSAEEREIYNFVETRSQAVFNKYLKAGTVLRNYANVLVMLLRLRQIAFHPALITEGYDALSVKTKDEKTNTAELARAYVVAGKVIVDMVRKERLSLAAAALQAEQNNKEAVVDDECAICMEPYSQGDAEGIVTQCGHQFCRGCITEVLNKAAAEAEEDPTAPKLRADERPCPTCRGPISDVNLFPLTAFEPTTEELEEATGISMEDDKKLEAEANAIFGEGKGKGNGKANNDDRDIDLDNTDDEAGSDDEEDDGPVRKPKGVKQKHRAVISDDEEEEEEEEEDDDDLLSDEDKKPKKKVTMKASSFKKKKNECPDWMANQTPSTKMIWLYEEIKRVHEEFPDDKFLVISSFTSALDMCDDFLRSKSVKFTRFQGNMSRKERDASIRVLSKSKHVKVMLMSLKAGGVGLNLVRANRVISLDLAWSMAVESQSFSRVHRIGQNKDVNVDRLTIANTVEQRIGTMQGKKQAISDAALGEGSGAKIGKLTVGQLAGLFGLTPDGAVA